MDHNKAQEYQFAVKQIGELQNHIAQVTHHVADLERLKGTVTNLEKSEDGTEILVPLGSGIFFKSKKAESDRVVMSVGADTLLEKGYSDAQKTIDEQIAEMKNILTQLQTNLNYLTNKEKELEAGLHHDCKCGPKGCEGSCSH